MLKKILFSFLIVLICGLSLNIDFYYSSYCPHCHKVLNSGVLEKVANKYNATLNKICVDNKENYLKMVKVQQYYKNNYNLNVYVGAVPTVVVYNKDWRNGSIIQGDDPIIENLENTVNKCLKEIEKCEKNISKINETHVTPLNVTSVIKNTSENSSYSVKVPFKNTSNKKYPNKNDILGKLFLTVSLSAADSINPCIMAILTLLLATLAKVDHRKAIKYAILFIVVVYISYFIIGLMLFYGMNIIINEFALSYGQYILWASCFILILIGLINIKEFFFFGKGISLKMPEKYAKLTKQLIEEGTVLSIIFLAAMITVVEFPCSGIMYLGFASTFIYWKSSLLEYLIYLILYNIIFVLPLILITYGYTLTQNVDQFKKFRLKYRRLFRLIMGIVMILLAIWLMLNYGLIGSA